MGRNPILRNNEKVEYMKIEVGRLVDMMLAVSKWFYFVSEIFTSEHLKLRNA